MKDIRTATLVCAVAVAVPAEAERWAQEGEVRQTVSTDFESGKFNCWPFGNGPGKITELRVCDRQAHKGQRSLRVSWRFEPKAESRTFVAVGGNWPCEGAPLRYTFWVHGDSSGGRLVVRLVDSSGEEFQRGLGSIDWTGWK